jgi:hypothetical protein
MPELAAGRVLIKTVTVGLNPVDTKMIGPFVTAGASYGVRCLRHLSRTRALVNVASDRLRRHRSRCLSGSGSGRTDPMWRPCCWLSRRHGGPSSTERCVCRVCVGRRRHVFQDAAGDDFRGGRKHASAHRHGLHGALRLARGALGATAEPHHQRQADGIGVRRSDKHRHGCHPVTESLRCQCHHYVLCG